MLAMVMIPWMLIACSLSGCGPSGRDLSDQQWLEMQQQLHDERTEVGHQRDLLEADRRQWDDRERSEPVLAAVISASVLLVCCVLPLLLVGVLLWPRKPEPAFEAVCEILLDDVLAGQATVASPPRLAAKVQTKRLANREE
jgi:hypothetical protein